MDRFRERFGTTQCGELTGKWANDFANPERAYRCGELVDFTLQQLTDVLDRSDESSEWQESWWDGYLQRRDKVE